LGTESIGWSVFSLDDECRVQNLEDFGVRIFHDGCNPKNRESLATERRKARSQRRIIFRRRMRRLKTFRLLQREKLFPETKSECIQLKSMNPYELRIKSLDEKLAPYELGRVLFNLSVRRGFKSNRKADADEKNETKSEKMTQAQKIDSLAQAMKSSGARTLGEFLWKNREENGGTRFAPGRMNYYPLRKFYMDEFDAIQKNQQKFFSSVDWDAIRHEIFYQRPLQPQERGKCIYLPEKDRTFKSMPCSQKMRILQDVYNLNFTKNGKQVNLPDEWRDELIKLLDSEEKVTFDKMRKKFGLDEKITFNLETESRTFLQGNSTAKKLRQEKCFGRKWDEFSLSEQDDIVETLISADENSDVEKMLEKYSLSQSQVENIERLNFQSGTANLCREISEKIVAQMEESHCRIHEAVEKLGFKYADQSVEKFDRLPYYGKILTTSTMGKKSNPRNDEEKFGRIANPTVHIALNQTRKVVNTLIETYGKPRQIVVEVSRDLKAGRIAREDILKRQAQNRKENERLNKEIRDENPQIPFPNKNDRLKQKLWEELGEGTIERRCVYCGKPIGGADIFSSSIQIEHILPFARTLCDSEFNKTVAHEKCNAFKGNRSPYEAFSGNPGGYNWSEIQERASNFKDPKKRRAFTENAMEIFEKESGFLSRQLTDNAYIAKSALKYLKSVVEKDSDVWAVSGGMTALLRKKWDLDSVLKRKIGREEIANLELKDEEIGTYKKNRFDHRHHALDAFVIAQIDRSMVQEISRLNQIYRADSIKVPELPVLREDLIEKTKNITVSFRPDHSSAGKLSEETPLGKIKKVRQIPVAELKKEQIKGIRSDKVRADFEAKFGETKDMKKTISLLKDIYPTISVYEEIFVKREYLSSLNENNIDKIIDEKIKNALKEFIKNHPDEKFEAVLEKFKNETGIKKVRCKNHVQVPIEIVNKDKTKRFLCPADYFAAVVWEIPPKKADGKKTYKATFIRRDQANSAEEKPQSDAKKICRVHKDDYLEFCHEGKWYKCRVAGYDTIHNRLDVKPIFATTSCRDWIISTNKRMLEPCWKPTKEHNCISVNKLFGEMQAHYITVSPIGKVCRKKQKFD
jgi:CRISPR-associated endonuclease Csn1